MARMAVCPSLNRLFPICILLLCSIESKWQWRALWPAAALGASDQWSRRAGSCRERVRFRGTGCRSRLTSMPVASAARQQSAARWPSEELGLPGMGAGDHVHGQEFTIGWTTSTRVSMKAAYPIVSPGLAPPGPKRAAVSFRNWRSGLGDCVRHTSLDLTVLELTVISPS